MSSDSAYNTVQTVTRFDNCTPAAQYRYDMVARPTVQGVQYGPFVDGDNYVVGCNISYLDARCTALGLIESGGCVHLF